VHGCRAALKQLFSLLKLNGIIVEEKQSADPPVIVQLIEGYDRHMNEAGGLAEATRLYRRRYARDFLLWSLEKKRLGLKELSAPHLMKYVTERARSLKPASAGVLAVSLRNFISFCEWNGLCARSLAKAVPTVAVWPHENLPKHLSPDQCQRFLACFDRSTPVGQRDFAMGLCLLDLGLRASEVSAMRIGHIDWRNGIAWAGLWSLILKMDVPLHDQTISSCDTVFPMENRSKYTTCEEPSGRLSSDVGLTQRGPMYCGIPLRPASIVRGLP
jgi:integrase